MTLPQRISHWRRRVFLGSAALFAAAWIAVAGLGRQATTSAPAQTSAATSSQTQTSVQTPTSPEDPYSGYDDADSQDDMSAATTSQS